MQEAEKPEFIESFRSESIEALAEMEPALMSLKESIEDGTLIPREELDILFGGFHSMKRSTGILSLCHLCEVVHEAETLLNRFRKAEVKPEISHIDSLSRVCDLLHTVLDQLTDSGSDEDFGPECHAMATILAREASGPQGEPLGDKAARFPPSDSASCPIPNPGCKEICDGGCKNSVQTGSMPTAEQLTADAFGQFIDEAMALTEELISGLEDLSSAPDAHLLHAVFQVCHTLKGNCALMGFRDPELLCHGMENVLVALEDSGRLPTTDVSETLLGISRSIRASLEGLVPGREPEITGLEPLLDLLVETEATFASPTEGARSKAADTAAAREPPAVSCVVDANASIDAPVILVAEDNPMDAAVFRELTSGRKEVFLFAADGQEALEMLKEMLRQGKEPELLLTDIKMPRLEGETLAARAHDLLPELPVIAITSHDDQKLLKRLLEAGFVSFLAKPLDGRKLERVLEACLKKRRNARTKMALGESHSSKTTARRESIRVDVQKLDRLLNLMGELVIAQSMVLAHPDLARIGERDGFDRSAEGLRRVVADLQDVTMDIRMVSLEGLFGRMKRVVSDLSRRTGKPVTLQVSGESTAVDKMVLEKLADPLMHMLRNSVDHGLESPEERASLGKPTEGRIRLEARQLGNEIHILIADDGKGLDRETILSKARERGLVQEDGAQLSDREIYGFIFAAGFSTATAVTEISGRGVGMDVVRSTVEKVRGRILIDSVRGQGTRFTIAIPLALASIQGMLVRTSGTLYTIPVTHIRESCKVGHKMALRTPDGRRSVRLRDEILPVLDLGRMHHGAGDKPIENGILIVLQATGRPFALLVDEILHQCEAVIKSLGPYVGDVRGVSGCSILGDGSISLIADVDALGECLESGKVEAR